MIAQEIWFYDAKHHYEIPTGSTPMEAPNAGKGWYRPQLVCFQRLSRTFYTVLLIVYQMHLIDYLITLVFVRVCVCLSTDRLSNDYVRNSLPIFTKFCMPLRNVVVSKAIVCGKNRK